MPIFDKKVLDKLKETVGAETACEIIDLFFRHTPQRIETVRAGDREATAMALHTLKSSAGMLGAIELSELSEKLERLARDETAEPISPLVGELEEAYVRVRGLLQAERRRYGDD